MCNCVPYSLKKENDLKMLRLALKKEDLERYELSLGMTSSRLMQTLILWREVVLYRF